MKLTKDTFERIKMMLESLDESDVSLGLTTMDTTDFKNNHLYVLLMAKEANVKAGMWAMHANNMHSMFFKLGVDLDKPITFETVLNIAKQYNSSVCDIQFIMDRYANELRVNLNKKLGLSDNPIEKLTIKINDYDKQSGRVSNDLKGFDADGSILRDVPDNAEQTLE